MSTTMFKVVYGKPEPVAVQAEVPEWPNLDCDGDSIYENTHFLTLRDAWEKLIDETTAGVALESSSLIRFRKELAEKEKKLVEAVLIDHEAKEKYSEWMLSEEKPVLRGGSGSESE